MTKSHLLAATAAMSAFSLTACSSIENSSPNFVICPSPGITLDKGEVQMVAGQNDFAWRMFGKVNAGNDLKSIVVSPLSMAYCLGMVNNGAAGQTSDEITKAFGMDGGTDDMNGFCLKMMKMLPALDPQTTFDIANYVEVNKDYDLQKDFKKAVKNYYDALVESRDFRESGFKDYLNGWVSKQTKGMIPELFKDVDPTAVSYIINALYFKSVWTNKFDKTNTTKDIFTKADGSTTKVDMMHQTDEFNYSSNEAFSALSMNYGNGAFSMQVLLPAEGKSISDVVTAMKGVKWVDFVRQMSRYEVNISLPKFNIEYGGTMKELLRSLGISIMFTPQADFSKFCNIEAYVSDVIQKAKIEVDEEGTKAAAATVTGMVTTSINPTPTADFRADRPFVFVITENSTGTISFIGQYSGN